MRNFEHKTSKEPPLRGFCETVAWKVEARRRNKMAKTISHFPIENRKASRDCLEGQRKVAENFKS